MTSIRRTSDVDRLRLLVSVRDAREAAIALAAGVDVIDVKEPRRGSLGRADDETLRSVAALAKGAVASSFAAGEAIEEGVADREEELAASGSPEGYAFFKYGPVGLSRRDDWRDVLARCWRSGPRGAAPIAVAYVDYLAAGAPEPEAIAALAIDEGCAGLLFDTFGKAPGLGLVALPGARLADCIRTAKQAGLLVALAGSLGVEHVARVESLGADVLAVRGAVCVGNRDGGVDRAKIDALRDAIAQHASPQRCERASS